MKKKIPISIDKPKVFIGNNFKVIWPETEIQRFLKWFSESVYDNEVGIGTDKKFMLFQFEDEELKKKNLPYSCVYISATSEDEGGKT